MLWFRAIVIKIPSRFRSDQTGKFGAVLTRCSVNKILRELA